MSTGKNADFHACVAIHHSLWWCDQSERPQWRINHIPNQGKVISQNGDRYL